MPRGKNGKGIFSVMQLRNLDGGNVKDTKNPVVLDAFGETPLPNRKRWGGGS